MKSDKQALLEIMPEEAKLSQQQIALDASKGHLHNLWDRYNEARGHNSCRQSCAEKLAEKVVKEQKIINVLEDSVKKCGNYELFDMATALRSKYIFLERGKK